MQRRTNAVKLWVGVIQLGEFGCHYEFYTLYMATWNGGSKPIGIAWGKIKQGTYTSRCYFAAAHPGGAGPIAIRGDIEVDPGNSSHQQAKKKYA